MTAPIPRNIAMYRTCLSGRPEWRRVYNERRARSAAVALHFERRVSARPAQFYILRQHIGHIYRGTAVCHSYKKLNITQIAVKRAPEAASMPGECGQLAQARCSSVFRMPPSLPWVAWRRFPGPGRGARRGPTDAPSTQWQWQWQGMRLRVLKLGRLLAPALRARILPGVRS